MHSWPKVCWNSSSTASVQLTIVSAAKTMKICFFWKSRIGNRHIYIYRNSIDSIFHAFMTQGVLEQLVSRFNAAADGNCSYNNENLLFFRSRIGNRYIYSHSNIITSLVHWHDCCWFHWMMNFTVSSKYLVFLYEYIAYVLHYKDLSLIITSCSMHS